MADVPERLDSRSHDVAGGRRQELLRLFPEVRTEGGKVDFERLKLALGEAVDAGRERYGLTWPGKADCFKTIQAPSLATLRPRPEESVEFDSTQNVIIEGDNLEVLKLLQKSYLGKVKLIYIDPPYNTGKEFIYPDNYSESLQTYLEYTGQVDAEGRKFSTNTDADGRFHSKWLSMMYPRLYLARNLLAEDGVIFVSCDDHEAHNARAVLNEVFGEEEFVGTVVWEKADSPRNSARQFSEDHEFVLVYAKSPGWTPQRLARTDEANAIYANPDNDPRGPWLAGDPYANNPYSRGTYTLKGPTGREFSPPPGRYWRVSEERLRELDADGRIWWGAKKDARPSIKRYLSEVSDLVPRTLWRKEDVGSNRTSKNELRTLFPDVESFDTPKPTSLVQRMLSLGTTSTDGDIVLDFFAGSGTTADAVLRQNAEDAGNRRFILVQLPEPTQHKDFATISEVTKERVRRAITRLNEAEKGQLPMEGTPKYDRGFRVFQLAESNFKPWPAEGAGDADALARQMELHIDNVVPGRTDADVLYEVLLKSGYPLTVAVERLTLAGKTVHSVDGGVLLVCLDRPLTLEAVREMAARKPQRVVCLDAAFAGDDPLKANAVQIFKAQGVTSFKTV
jgi:adenine-specific DNA-methyltransferase